jgi:exopolyphosphatase/pppGpp-phosphohydrolase
LMDLGGGSLEIAYGEAHEPVVPYHWALAV